MISLRENIWPVAASLLLHGALVAFVFVGWQKAEPRNTPKTPQYIEAKLVELKPKAQQAVSAKPEQVQKVDLTKQRREQELAEQRAREERQRQAEAKRRAEREKQAELERQKAEEARRKREEEARRREAEAERERQQQQQLELEKALREEQGLIQEHSYATEAQSYTQAIARRIEQHWSRPSSARNNMQALLSIQMVPTGRVVNVSVVKSSGNAAFDRSAEQAVRAVEVFPEVKEMPPEIFERYYRRFNLLFNPQDLRQ